MRSWWVIAGMFLLAAFTNGLRNSDQTPPLTVRRVLIRAVLAGIAAMACGLVAIDRMTVGWALLLGAAGAIGYVGVFVESLVRSKGGGGEGGA